MPKYTRLTIEEFRALRDEINAQLADIDLEPSLKKEAAIAVARDRGATDLTKNRLTYLVEQGLVTPKIVAGGRDTHLYGREHISTIILIEKSRKEHRLTYSQVSSLLLSEKNLEVDNLVASDTKARDTEREQTTEKSISDQTSFDNRVEFARYIENIITRVDEIKTNLAQEYSQEALIAVSQQFIKVNEDFTTHLSLFSGKYYEIIHRSQRRLTSVKKASEQAKSIAQLFEKYSRKPLTYSMSNSINAINGLAVELLNIKALLVNNDKINQDEQYPKNISIAQNDLDSYISATSTILPIPEEARNFLDGISPYTIQDHALEKHAAADKPIQKVEQDRLGFGVYVKALHDFIVSQYTTTPLTISVDGPWGTGKSSLMYMLKNSLEPQNNVWESLVTWVKTIIQVWKWGWSWFWALPVQTAGMILLKLSLKFDQNNQEFDFRIGTNNSRFRSLVGDIAQGLATNPEVLKQENNKLSRRVFWWANIHARCQPMESISHPTVWLNAWKFDNQEEVWAALALATLDQIKQKHNIFWMAWFRIRLTFKRLSLLPAFSVVFVQFVLPVVLGILAFYYDIIISSFEKPLEVFKNIPVGDGNYLLWAGAILGGIFTASSVFKDPFQIPVDKIFDRPSYKEKIGFLARFENDFSKIIELVTKNGFGWKKSKLVIFIDDLDRCEPPKATDIVEAVNLFLDAEGCVFVIGMDSEAVAMSIEVKYIDLFTRMKAENAGVVSLGRAFLDKIVQIPFTVPRPTSRHILTMVEDTLGGDRSKSIVIAKPLLLTMEERGQLRKQKTPLGPGPSESIQEVEINKDNTDEELDPASFEREEVRQAIRMGVELLSENPRQVKTFVNLFRLSIYIANARGFFEEERTGEKIRLMGLERLAIWTVYSVRWQNLIKHLHVTAQTDSLREFLIFTSKHIPATYKWAGGVKVPEKIKNLLARHRESEKSSEAHWCHLPWDWWLLELDFLKCVKLSESLWTYPNDKEIDWLNVFLTMTKPISQ